MKYVDRVKYTLPFNSIADNAPSLFFSLTLINFTSVQR